MSIEYKYNYIHAGMHMRWKTVEPLMLPGGEPRGGGKTQSAHTWRLLLLGFVVLWVSARHVRSPRLVYDASPPRVGAATLYVE